MTLVDIDKVRMGERFRSDLGNLQPLIDSIEQVGLLHPVVITDSYELVAGQRRIEALKRLGYEQVEARVLPLSPAEMLRAEHDENEVRKDFTPTERVAIARRLEDEVARQAKERQSHGQTAPGRHASETITEAPTREIVGKAVGWSGPSYQRAKAVVIAAEEDPERFGDLAEQLDETENIAGTFRELQSRRQTTNDDVLAKVQRISTGQRAKQIRKLAEQGHRSAQIGERLGVAAEYVRKLARENSIALPDDVIGKTRHVDPNRIVSETIATLEGVAMGLELLNGDVDQLDTTHIEYWATSLSKSLRPLNRLRKQLKEVADAQQ